MKKHDPSAATGVAVAVTAAAAQKGVQPAVTDSQLRMVKYFSFEQLILCQWTLDHLLLRGFLLCNLIAFYVFSTVEFDLKQTGAFYRPQATSGPLGVPVGRADSKSQKHE